MPHAILIHGGSSLWLEVTLGLVLAVSLLAAAELLARRVERRDGRERPMLRGRSAPALTTDLVETGC